MSEKNTYFLFIDILRLALSGTGVSRASLHAVLPDEITALCALAVRHAHAGTLSVYIYKNHLPVPQDLWARLHRQAMLSVYRAEHQKQLLHEVCAAFDAAGIAYIPLKGAVIRGYYPDASLRTSCDVDVLIHPEEVERAVSLLKEQGYRRVKSNFHDISLLSPNGAHLELHFSLREKLRQADPVLQEVWEHATPKEGARYELSPAFFAFYLYAHTAYHFLAGGCGITALTDVWVLEHRMGISMDVAQPLLQRAGLYPFARALNELANLCFSGGLPDDRPDEHSERILTYILQGGPYGASGNRLALQKARGESGCELCALRRLFLPYREMLPLYPVLQKAPVLLPACYLIRAFRSLLDGSARRLARRRALVRQLPDELLLELEQMQSRLELDAQL